jgi:hypothetical protein
MFDAFIPLHILFWLMSALTFYFVNRNHVKVKFDLNSNRFVIYKMDLKIEKDFPFCLGSNLCSTLNPAQPAYAASTPCAAQLRAEPLVLWPSHQAGFLPNRIKLTRPDPRPHPLATQYWVYPNQNYPLSDFVLILAIWSRLPDKMDRLIAPDLPEFWAASQRTLGLIFHRVQAICYFSLRLEHRTRERTPERSC